MRVRYVLTRRWLGGLAVIVCALLAAALAVPTLIGAERAIPTSTMVPIAVALVATAVACAAGVAATGTHRTPYW